jgi:3-dehydroquinate dehydratase type I
MLCITGAERTVAALRERVARHPQAELLEVRLDLLAEPLDALSALEVDPRRLIVACRPQSEGGEYSGEEESRLGQLERLLEEKPGWIEVELSCEEARRDRLVALARERGVKVLISHHESEAASSFQARAIAALLAAASGDAVKLSMPVSDTAELDPLLQIGKRAMLPMVLLGQGTAGMLSQALYTRMGSFMTYVASRPGDETYVGQLTLEQLSRFRAPPGRDTSLYVLMGGPQVLTSPGLWAYNRLFASREINACYLPVITRKPAESLYLLKAMGLKGASVTMPLKQQVAPMMDVLGKKASAAAVVNTITVDTEGQFCGSLTEGRGAVIALQKAAGSLSGKRAVILGTGATAAAIAQGMVAAGVLVTILGRERGRTDVLARRFGAESGHMNELHSVPFDVLVQTTPVGTTDEDATLVEYRRLLAGKIVLDVVLSEQETRLLRDTREAGGIPVSGSTLWAEQSCLQLEHWFSLNLSSEDLEAELKELKGTGYDLEQ